eukprot:12901986-Prorocentrum_lima.AAC.1
MSCRPRSNAFVILLVTILAYVYLVHVSLTCCQGSFPDSKGGMSVLSSGKSNVDWEACESTKRKSCCTTWLNDVTRREVATLR